MNPYEKKHKAETSKDQPTQPGTTLLKGNQRGRTLYAKERTHARKEHRKEGLRVGSRSRCFLVFNFLCSLRILHASPITKKSEAEKAPYPCLLISPAHMKLKNESKPKESRAEQGNETLKMQGRAFLWVSGVWGSILCFCSFLFGFFLKGHQRRRWDAQKE
jgi:hypothetical protein